MINMGDNAEITNMVCHIGERSITEFYIVLRSSKHKRLNF
jgi:hypothetical protein